MLLRRCGGIVSIVTIRPVRMKWGYIIRFNNAYDPPPPCARTSLEGVTPHYGTAGGSSVPRLWLVWNHGGGSSYKTTITSYIRRIGLDEVTQGDSGLEKKILRKKLGNRPVGIYRIGLNGRRLCGREITLNETASCDLSSNSNFLQGFWVLYNPRIRQSRICAALTI